MGMRVGQQQEAVDAGGVYELYSLKIVGRTGDPSTAWQYGRQSTACT